jgi:Zn-dependent membrane protease YugP
MGRKVTVAHHPSCRKARWRSTSATLLARRGQLSTTEDTVIILGLVLLVVGFLLKISILWILGIILLVIGAVLAVLGATGRAVGGRRHYF